MMEYESNLRENLSALRELNSAQRTLVEDCLSILESMGAARRKPPGGKTAKHKAPNKPRP